MPPREILSIGFRTLVSRTSAHNLLMSTKKNCRPLVVVLIRSPTGPTAVVLQKNTAAFCTQTVAVTTDGDDVTVVQQPVQNGCGNDGFDEHRVTRQSSSSRQSRRGNH